MIRIAIRRSAVQVVILSGGYGAVAASQRIRWYNQRFEFDHWLEHKLPEALSKFANGLQPDNVIGFFKSPSEAPEYEQIFDLFITLGFGKTSPVRNYSGRINGEVVATSSLFLGSGVAGIYNVARLSKVRRRGIGNAMTLEPLREARALGYQIAVLASSQLGVGVCRKIGFKEYCKIGQYLWTKTGNNSVC
jgi:ribosomal protein S18 acetylase RimI-like enzyme